MPSLGLALYGTLRAPVLRFLRSLRLLRRAGAVSALCGITHRQQRLRKPARSEQLGVAQQTLAHYEVGRARMPASMLPTVARLLTLSLDELMGQRVPGGARAGKAASGGKRGPASRLEQQIQAVAQLPKTKQQFVSQMLDTVLAQVGR